MGYKKQSLRNRLRLNLETDFYSCLSFLEAAFDAADFDIGFVGDKSGFGFVIIVGNERLDCR